MKKSLVAIASAIVLLFASSCSKVEAPKLVSFHEEVSTSAEIVERINNMGDASLENEAVIESIFIDYTRLSDSEKAQVSNYEALDNARNSITKLYHTEEKDGPRIDRSKIQIGTYCVYRWDDQHISWINEAGIDFIVGVGNSATYLDLCSKYNIGAFISYLPGWWGGDGDNAGGYANSVPSGSFDGYAANFVDHPAIWAVDVGDEPSALDFPHYGVMIDEAKALFPNQLVYLNLYPIYASVNQQGTLTYEEHIQIYVDNIDTDYLSFDFYDIDQANEKGDSERFLLRHVENLRIVAEACREKGIDMWTVMQAGVSSSGGVGGYYLNTKQLNSQLYTSLAYGSQVINWACWESGWFDANTNMINSAGERTPAYYAVQAVNSNIKELSPVYMRYYNTDTAFIGNSPASTRVVYHGTDRVDFASKDGNVLNQDMFRNLKVKSDEANVIAGAFTKRSGEGDALLITNVSGFYGTEDYALFSDKATAVEISFTLKDPERMVVIYYPEFAYVMESDENGVYSFSLENTDGVFITAEPIA